MGVTCIPEEKRDIEYAYIWQKVWKRRACYESQIYRAKLDGFQHFDLTAQSGIRILLDLVATLCSLLDFVREYSTPGTKLRIRRQDISELQYFDALRRSRCEQVNRNDQDRCRGATESSHKTRNEPKRVHARFP